LLSFFLKRPDVVGIPLGSLLNPSGDWITSGIGPKSFTPDNSYVCTSCSLHSDKPFFSSTRYTISGMRECPAPEPHMLFSYGV
jgi:hypothetical protein